MYKIKQIPDDFIVKEISAVKPKKEGDFSYYALKKTNCTTIKALQIIAKKLGLKLKQIGFAGTKDKKAVTLQLISIKTGRNLPKELELDNIKICFAGKGENPVCLGDLKGNEFEITVRNLDSVPDVPAKTRILNLFDEQRFSINNVEIGKAIVKKDFKKAVELILKNKERFKGEYESDVDEYLEKKPNDFVGALRVIPRRILLLFVHSFQSDMWNKTAIEIAKNPELAKDLADESVEIIGFGTEFKNKEVKGIAEKLLKKHDIKQRDFIIKPFPELSSEGNERPLFVKISDLKVVEQKNDELNPGKKKVKISFSLPKASYATTVIKNLFS